MTDTLRLRDWTALDIALGVAIVLLLAIALSSVVDPAQTGGRSLVGMVWLPAVLCAYYLGRRRAAKRPWQWAVAAVAACVAIEAVGAFAPRSHEDQAAIDELVSAARQLDPSSGDELAKLSRSSDDSDRDRVQQMLGPMIAAAIASAPDNAIVEFTDARQAFVMTRPDDDIGRCAAAASGESNGSIRPPTKEEESRMLYAEAALIRAAANNRSSPARVPTKEEIAPILASVYRKVDPDGALVEAQRASTLTLKQRCDLYIAAMAEVRSLPLADRALVLRYFTYRQYAGSLK